MKNLIEFLNSHDGFHLEELQELVYKVYDEFMTVYQRLIPALAIQYCKENSFDFEHEGSTTSSFDSVKQFYLDAYEALGNLLVIPVALNNIKYRSDINAMNPIEKNVNSLEDYIKLTKASRYHFCLDSEVYTSFLKTLVNAKLRNAIGHNDVEYNSVDQLITYIPNPKDRTKKKTEYLLQFENEAMYMFQAILGVSEYLYRLKELELMYDGKIPIMVQEIYVPDDQIEEYKKVFEENNKNLNIQPSGKPAVLYSAEDYLDTENLTFDAETGSITGWKRSFCRQYCGACRPV